MKWKTKDGRDIDIRDMSDSHLANTIAMLRGKGYIASEEIYMFLLSEPNGDAARDLYDSELANIKTHRALGPMETELRSRKERL